MTQTETAIRGWACPACRGRLECLGAWRRVAAIFFLAVWAGTTIALYALVSRPGVIPAVDMHNWLISGFFGLCLALILAVIFYRAGMWILARPLRRAFGLEKISLVRLRERPPEETGAPL